ncbi:MAG: FKBP-type peptidyl-prolyl cis-trans isomerase [Phenylobacterium sp.]|jgi:peptidylprolyl isomerase/FKBP-type peptidyl-prolyl cis-trans isomerase FklB|uniref:FKBP-type peptidyl-prolyl cis-trans isomerase n=1 Tax=Phenylobacterium sp. TaxID=1871053 RepID=UPI0025D675B7|nr:FKBP-type peptidyl-prolyl cis-trans isomerase [Phenylobacterium sp.]MCA6297692.1 FKBP-type peptidyl-prolyl cis-trans isomerase [Phenylobacterium sp.]
MRLALIALAAGLSLLAACQRGPDPKVLAANAEAGKAFLVKNAAEPGVKTLPSGLQYVVVRSGAADGVRPLPGDQIKVHYEGKLLSGEVFDSSYDRGVPAVMPLDGLIPGWVEALQLMRPGDEWRIFVPAELGYGDQGGGPIPPGATLVFRIELIDVLPGPRHKQAG